MKIDRRNPMHWLYLLAFGLNVACAMVLRALPHRRASGRILLYGHKLSGNLLGIHHYVQRHRPVGLRVAFLTMDPAYNRRLRRQGIRSVLALSPAAIPWLATADAVVSDHGLHAMQSMLGRTDLKFFDVWHGIPFKGFDAEDFRVQQRYDEVWVASPLLASMYVERFGFLPDRVKATGYARTDRLVAPEDADREGIATRLGLPADAGRIVLFAPTWKQDDQARSLFPFGTDEATFCAALSALAVRHKATFVFRTHLNSGVRGGATSRWPRLASLPYALYPDTEEILLVSDVLVCDWSSIAFDFLLLDRPTIFLDVEAPFAKGLSLDASHRFGALARDMNSMLALLERYLREPTAYDEDCGVRAAETKRRVYGGLADGRSAERCVARLEAALARAGSSR
jgi:CDP-glycerol glycerophosphotransferase